MDRNEAVQKLATVGRISIAHAEDLYDSIIPKPVVQQIVADWYEEIKDNFNYDLIEVINNIPYGADEEDFSDIEKWLDDNNDSLTTLVNMHQFGYEVEEETKYIVKFKGINNFSCYLNYDSTVKDWFVDTFTEDGENRVFHTRKELEDADCGWVFDCEGIEIEEVE